MPMKHSSGLKRKALDLAFGCVIFVSLCATKASAQQTYLDNYIAKPDPAYSWKLMNTIQGEGCKAYVLRLTSQTWRTAQEVDRPVWTHWLTIVKPDKVAHNKALLFIGGGSFKDAMPSAIPERSKRFAVETATVIAELSV